MGDDGKEEEDARFSVRRLLAFGVVMLELEFRLTGPGEALFCWRVRTEGASELPKGSRMAEDEGIESGSPWMDETFERVPVAFARFVLPLLCAL